jgi:hypothetical protein
MAEGSLILIGKIDHQKIGYIEGTEAFDSFGNKLCKYNPSTGNLLELDTGRTIGHVSLAGYFVGSSWIAEELFPLVAKNSPTTSPDQPGTADSTGLVISPDKAVTVESITLVISPDEAVTADPIASVTSSDKEVSVQFTPDKPVRTSPVAPATSLDDANAADSAASNASFHEPTAAGPVASFKAFSQESTPVELAAPLTTSLEDTAAADSIVSTTSPDEPTAAPLTETLLSINVEQQIHEMIRMTLAKKSVEPRRQTVKDVAIRMREHLAGLRRQRPRAGMIKMADFREQRRNRPNGLRS